MGPTSVSPRLVTDSAKACGLKPELDNQNPLLPLVMSSVSPGSHGVLVYKAKNVLDGIRDES